MIARERRRPFAAALLGALVAAALAGGCKEAPGEPPPPAAEEARALPLPPPVPAVDPPSDGRTGQAALRATFPLPAGAGPLVSIGEKLVAHGVPMNLATFDTDRTPASVLEFYALHFSARGLPWSGTDDNYEVVPFPSLSAVDVEGERQLSVMVMPSPVKGKTTVILGLADMANLEPDPPSGPDELPAYPGSTPLVVRSLEAGVAGATVTLSTPDAPEKVEAFYREALLARGFREERAEGGPNGSESGTLFLRFASPARLWSLTLSKNGSQTVVTGVGSARESQP